MHATRLTAEFINPSEKINRKHCEQLDKSDPLAAYHDQFQAPVKNTIFLDANSMGAMPKAVPSMMQDFFANAWVELRRQGWNHFEWMERPFQIGASLAHLLGANANDVIACDNTTVNLYKLLTYAWRIRNSGNVILTEDGNFPTDLYVAEGLPGVIDGNPVIRVCQSRTELVEAIDSDTAIVYLSHVDYRSGERWDMADINRRAQEVGALTLWDLSHSTGAIPVALMKDNADFAVGCGYKYLSGGPGGSAYLWVNPRHAEAAWPTICGWMGHGDVFAFATEYTPHQGAYRHATGTPAVIANEVFSCAADIWRTVDAPQLWDKHRLLGDLLIDLLEQECGEFSVIVNTPRHYDERGGHVGFSHEGAGPLCEALLDAGVVGSFRKPNALRFGLGSLYLSYADIWETVERLKDILQTQRWRDPKYQKVSV